MQHALNPRKDIAMEEVWLHILGRQDKKWLHKGNLNTGVTRLDEKGISTLAMQIGEHSLVDLSLDLLGPGKRPLSLVLIRQKA